MDDSLLLRLCQFKKKKKDNWDPLVSKSNSTGKEGVFVLYKKKFKSYRCKTLTVLCFKGLFLGPFW